VKEEGTIFGRSTQAVSFYEAEQYCFSALFFPASSKQKEAIFCRQCACK
jgi:hypothetical protein